MLPKALVSLIGRLAGIAAVLAAPLTSSAAEPSPTPQSSPSVHRPAQPRVHGKTPKKAIKRGARHLAKEQAPASSEPMPEVTAERVSTKSAPKPSTTPLPTLAAATTKPLIEPIGVKGASAFDARAHAAEPRATPVIRASTRPAKESTPARSLLRSGVKASSKQPCLHAPVDIQRGGEEQSIALTKCDGTVAPLAVEELSVLVRPGDAPKPSGPIADVAAKSKGDLLAPGIRKVDERLVERMQILVDHFSKPGTTPKLYVVSGYRPASKGSFHANGRAIDFRLEGIENTDLVAFCKTLPDTGCGFYPNSSFVHLDVRDSGAGHVSWIDASGPGEKPDYVASWPLAPKEDDDPVKLLAKLDELQILPPPSHDGEPGEEPKLDKPEAAALTKKLDVEN
jgi:hypothetical protein